MVALQALIGITGSGGPADQQSNSDGYYSFPDGSYVSGGIRTTPASNPTERRYRLEAFGFPPSRVRLSVSNA